MLGYIFTFFFVNNIQILLIRYLFVTRGFEFIVQEESIGPFIYFCTFTQQEKPVQMKEAIKRNEQICHVMENEKNTFNENATMNVKGKEKKKVKYFLFPQKTLFMTTN